MYGWQTRKGKESGMHRAIDAVCRRAMVFMPAVILGMGCIADVALNVAITDPQTGRFLPEVCGLVVGALTVLTFARRRHAYLAAGAIFALVEMTVVTVAVPSAPRLGLCAASLATAFACLLVYARGSWASPDTRMAE
jgi:hypothetical protein